KDSQWRRHAVIFLALVGLGFIVSAGAFAAAQPVSYTIDLTNPEAHLVGVTMTVPHAHAATEIQFPAWNTLYTIRDFVRHVDGLHAECSGAPLELRPVDVYTFQIGREPCSPLVVRYEVYANESGVFSSELIPDHAFLNLAQVLFYVPNRRNGRDVVRFVVPQEWKLVTFLPGSSATGAFMAADYDALVDSPVEAGLFQSYSYTQGGALYRLIVRGDPGDYSSAHLIDTVEKITAAETALMRNRPFSRYTFIFHFPASGSGGGMEHSYGAAISFPAPLLRTNWEDFENTIAHEFFHLWNVKRIRPQGLVPVDYIHGNDTRDLWFCEGVTSTYAELVLLRAGLISREDFYHHVAGAIERLQRRPARHFQSVELAGIDAWLESYPDYFRADRSISYYNKGELLGDLLDLAIRHASGNAHSLDDVMRRLNVDFAERGRPFNDGDLENIVAALGPSSAWVRGFFERDVDGTDELDYQKILGFAGLKLATYSSPRPDWGFSALRGFDGVIRVAAVDAASRAAQAGIRDGDVLESVDGQRLYALPGDVTGLRPGQTVKLRVARGSRLLTLKFALGSKSGIRYRIEDVPSAPPPEILVRDGWLDGTTSLNATVGKP
ncbi:MAG: M61 family metallopeptidase, partial [Terriglobia bacterium]